MADNVALMKAWLDIFAEGEFESFPGEVSPDFVLHLPFVPPGVASEIRGREKVLEVVRGAASRRSKLEFEDVRILRTEDPELLVATARGHATMADGRPYRNQYVFMTRIRDGVVLEHTEYLNPLEVMASTAERD